MEVFESQPTSLVECCIVLQRKNLVFCKQRNIVKETDVTLLSCSIQIRFIYLEIEGVLDGYEVIDPHSYSFEEIVASLVERRRVKWQKSASEFCKTMSTTLVLCLVHWESLMSAGVRCDSPTAAIFRPALQIIKTRRNVKRHFRRLPHGSWIWTLLVLELCD